MTVQTPIHTQYREGNQDSPYVYKNENLIIDKSAKAFLTEFPDRLYGVEVQSLKGVLFYETQEYSVRENEFRVDYESKTKSITFHQSQIGQQLNFKYKGTGLSYLSPSQIYTELNEDGVMETLDVYIKNMSKLQEQIKNLLEKGSVSSVAGKSGIVTNGDIHLIDTVLDGNAGNSATFLPLGVTLYPVKSKNINYPAEKGFVVTYKHSNIQTVQFFYPTEKEATLFRSWMSNTWSDWKTLTTATQVNQKIEQSALRTNTPQTLVGRAIKDVKGLNLSIDLGGLSGSKRLVKDGYKLEFTATKDSMIERISFPVNGRGSVKLVLFEKKMPEPKEDKASLPIITEVDVRELYLQPVDVSHLILFPLKKGKTYQLSLVDMSVDVLFESDFNAKDIAANEYIKNTQLTLNTSIINGYAYFYDMQFSYNITYQEVVDARVAFFSEKAHATLSERLLEDFSYVKNGLDRVKFVDDFGAKGDGKTDDTDAIQKALDTKGVIYFRSDGVYRISRALEITSDTHLKGNGAVVQRGTSDERCAYLFINGRWKNNDAEKYNGEGNITFENITIDSNVDEFPTVSSPVALNHGHNINFHRVTFKNVGNGHGIDFNGCINSRVEDCNFLGYRDLTESQTRIYAEAIQLSSSLEASFPYLGSFDGTPCKNITIKNCYTGNSDAKTTVAWGVAVGNHSASYNRHTNIYISDCHFTGGKYFALRLYSFDNVHIDNLFVEDFNGLVNFNAINASDASEGANPNPNEEEKPSDYTSGLVTTNAILRNINFTQKKKSKFPAIRAWGSYEEDMETVAFKHRDVIFDGVSIKSDNFITAADIDGVSDFTFRNMEIQNIYRGFLLKNINGVHFRDITIKNATERAIYFQRNAKKTTITNLICDGYTTEKSDVSGINMTENTTDVIMTNVIMVRRKTTLGQWDIYASPRTNNIKVTNCHAKIYLETSNGQSNFDGYPVSNSLGDRYFLIVDQSGTIISKKV